MYNNARKLLIKVGKIIHILIHIIHIYKYIYMTITENYRITLQFPTKGNQSFDNFSHIKLCVLLGVLGKTKWDFLHLCLSIKEQTDMRENHFSKDFRTTNYLHNMPTQEVANCDV